MCLQVHVDGEAGAALSPFLPGLGLAQHRAWQWIFHEVQPTAVPGALDVPRWGFGCCCWQRQQRCGSGSEAAAPAPKLEHEGLERQAGFVSGAVACGALTGVPLDFAGLISRASRAAQFLQVCPW